MSRPSGRSVATRYRSLKPETRAGLWILIGLEVILIAWAERDIHRRDAAEIRGPKLLWRLLATQNVIGPTAYFAIGRRQIREDHL